MDNPPGPAQMLALLLVVRAVLVNSDEEERRLAETLPHFDRDADVATLEDWLAEQGFRPVATVSLSLGRGQGGAAGRSRPRR